jgi:hypothetical protein
MDNMVWNVRRIVANYNKRGCCNRRWQCLFKVKRCPTGCFLSLTEDFRSYVTRKETSCIKKTPRKSNTTYLRITWYRTQHQGLRRCRDRLLHTKDHCHLIDKFGVWVRACVRSFVRSWEINLNFSRRGNCKFLFSTASPYSFCQVVADISEAVASIVKVDVTFNQIHLYGSQNVKRHRTGVRAPSFSLRRYQGIPLNEMRNGAKICRIAMVLS